MKIDVSATISTSKYVNSLKLKPQNLTEEQTLAKHLKHIEEIGLAKINEIVQSTLKEKHPKLGFIIDHFPKLDNYNKNFIIKKFLNPSSEIIPTENLNAYFTLNINKFKESHEDIFDVIWRCLYAK